MRFFYVFFTQVFYHAKHGKMGYNIDRGEQMKDKEILFIHEWLSNGKNATQAYLKIYDCKYNTASVESTRLLRKESVQKYIKELGDNDGSNTKTK